MEYGYVIHIFSRIVCFREIYGYILKIYRVWQVPRVQRQYIYIYKWLYWGKLVTLGHEWYLFGVQVFHPSVGLGLKTTF